jgi:membrane protease YdiL (CAAX protease family)
MTQRTWWNVGLKPFLQMLVTVAALALAVRVVWGVGGAALITAVMGVLVAAGAYHLSAGAGPASVGPALTTAVLTGFVEELVIRGAVMTWLVAWTGGWGALALSPLIFGALHLADLGVEASPVAVLVCLALAVPTLVVAARRGRIPGPAWGTRTGRLRLLEEAPGRVSR